MASRQLVIFSINGEDFGIDINQVNSIEKMMEIFQVPNTPNFIEGLINLRGKVYTVLNLRKRFNLPARDFDDNTKIIIVNIDTSMIGFIVDEVKEIITFDDADLEATPDIIKGVNRRFLSGVAKKGEKIVLILDLSQVLSAEEELQVNSIAR